MRKKKPAFSCELFFKYGGEGGIDSLRSPYGQPVRFALSLSNWLSPVVEPRSGVLIPPFSENIKEKSPYFRTSSHLKYGGEGGIDSLRSPYGQPVRFALSLSNWLSPVVEPRSGVLIPPFSENIKEKSPYFRTSSHLKYGGEGGIDSLRSPYGQPVRFALSLSNWLSPVVEPRSGVLIPPFSENIKEKSPYFRTSSHLKYGGEGGIRTPDTLPYTHFPGVLLQPLGHLTILSSRCCRDGR